MQGALFNMHILQPARVQRDAVCSYVHLCTIVQCLTLCSVQLLQCVTCYIIQCNMLHCAVYSVTVCSVQYTVCLQEKLDLVQLVPP